MLLKNHVHWMTIAQLYTSILIADGGSKVMEGEKQIVGSNSVSHAYLQGIANLWCQQLSTLQ